MPYCLRLEEDLSSLRTIFNSRVFPSRVHARLVNERVVWTTTTTTEWQMRDVKRGEEGL